MAMERVNSADHESERESKQEQTQLQAAAVDPTWTACNLNRRNIQRLPLFLGSSSSSSYGNHHNDYQMCMSFALHVAASKGHTEIAREILMACPELALKLDEDKSIPLHHACSKGHSEVARMLLKHKDGEAMALRVNNAGYMSLHLAVMNDNTTTTLEAFMEKNPGLFNSITRNGDTVFHLAARFNRIAAFEFMARAFGRRHTGLLHCPDQFGDTVLHIAVAAGHNTLAEFIIKETGVNINQRNGGGLTALDMVMVKIDESSAAAENIMSTLLMIKDMLVGVISEREYYDRGQMIISPSASSTTDYYSIDIPPHHQEISLSSSTLAAADQSSQQQQQQEISDSSSSSSSRSVGAAAADQSQQQRTAKEALLNAMNTITQVAATISSLAYAAGVSPQSGRSKGIMIVYDFMFFASVGVLLLVLSLFPPLRNNQQMWHLSSVHKKAMVVLAFYAVSYVVLSRLVSPGSWELHASVAISGGGLVAIYLWLLWAFH